jgi:hypothetical protein
VQEQVRRQPWCLPSGEANRRVPPVVPLDARGEPDLVHTYYRGGQGV